MPLEPTIGDYEPVFPSRARHGSEPERWPAPEKSKSFDDPAIKAASPANQKAASNTTLWTTSADWIRRKGHTLTFCALFVFTVVLYLRPYELVPALSSFTSMAFYVGVITLAIFVISQIAAEGNLTTRTQEVNLVLLLCVTALLIFVVIVNVVRTQRRLSLLILLALGVSVYLSICALQDYQSGLFGIG